MRLASGEHSILATFPSSTKAKAAKAELEQAGITEIQIDRVSRFGTEFNDQYNNPIAGQADTLTGLALYSADRDQFNDQDARILQAADPSVSGFGNYQYGVAGGEAFLLTIVTRSSKLNQALRIIERQGGTV